jgi:hypothetical protein
MLVMVGKSSRLNDDEGLIDSWLAMHHAREDSAEYKENMWAEFELSNLAQDDPETCWELILEILRRDQTPKVIQGLAAGALEDLLGAHGPEFIGRVEERAQADKHFQHLLGGVWQNEMTEEIWKRVQSVSGERW